MKIFMWPMFIRALHLSNFRSFRAEQTVEFGEKNIVLGKNGAGKSNLLAAIWSVFLQEGDANPQYGGDEGTAVVRLDIDNTERRFPMPRYFTLSAEWRHGIVSYCCDGRPLSRDELRSLVENAGLTAESLVRQGMVNALAEDDGSGRYAYLERVSGAAMYERNRSEAMRCLEEEGDARIEELLEKLELSGERTEGMRKKQERYCELRDARAKAEYEIMVVELRELTEEIERLAAEDVAALEDRKGDELDEGLIDLELKERRERMCQIREEIDGLEEYLRRVMETPGDAKDGSNKHTNQEDGKENKMHTNKKQSLSSFIGNQSMTNSAQPAACSQITPEYVEELKRLREKYERRVEEERKGKERAQEAYERLAAEEKELYVLGKAERYYEAMKEVKEPLDEIRTRLEVKRKEIAEWQADPEKQMERPQDQTALIAERKGLWIKEAGIREELKGLRMAETQLANRMLYLGKEAVNVYDRIKGEPGVLGNVYSLFAVPDDLEDAYTAVTQGSLFWIVTEDDATAVRLAATAEGRVTFVALNVLEGAQDEKVGGKAADIQTDTRLIRLADSLRCEKKYRRLLEFVCKGFYLCADLPTALELSAAYGINVVTMEGDLVRRSGLITGGYERGSSVLRDLRRCRRRIASAERHLGEYRRAIQEVEARLAMLSEEDNDGEKSRGLEDLMAVELYLLWKLREAAGKEREREKRLTGKHLVEIEHRKAEEQLSSARAALAIRGAALSRAMGKRDWAASVVARAERLGQRKKELDSLRAAEQQLIEHAYGRGPGKADTCEATARKQRRHMLIDRRSALLAKTGISDPRSLPAARDKELLIAVLKETRAALRDFHGFERLALPGQDEGDAASLRDRLSALAGNRSRILAFVAALDQKKVETMRGVFATVAEHFPVLFKRLTGNEASLVLRGNAIDITTGSGPVAAHLLSGGQKTVLALALILAVHRAIPSPFYLFDEADANLDAVHRTAFYDILAQEDAQYFITSFKQESIQAGSRFYGIASTNRESFIAEIDRKLALETI